MGFQGSHISYDRPMSADSLLYDISRPLDDSIAVWPGDIPFQLEWTSLQARGDSTNVSALRMSAHTGTHADAPCHAVEGGAAIGDLALSIFIGPARLVDSRGKSIDRALLSTVGPAGQLPPRLLFRTGAWTSGAFPSDFPALDANLVSILQAAGVVLVGTDAPSVDPMDAVDLPAHRALASAGIAILENLLLDHVPEGDYELIALPLRLAGGDGSPVRAVLRRR